ncbi:hypothetical protein [Pseudomonas sp. PH1b]|uniref:hypothetical protein n=1 Tax=Pseudomonas sp. PH1b TaxID=1397282 RepID=UPI00046B08AC|nr:hypothetical protein [Pseudomonas sp. PH1b]BFD38574.1 hypothetical protein FFPRI1PSEUD_00730 [Pseudomonas sp. FFPRI_1]
MTRPTDRPLSWAALLHGLGRSGTAALIVGCLFSLGLSSAAAGNDSRLEQIGYREALAWFHSQKYESSGAWLCGYSLAHEDYSVAPKAPRLLVEVDERYLYLKTGGKLVELTGAAQSPQRSEYQSAGAAIRVTLDILKRNNFSEYQESHDRQVLAKIEMNDQVETLTLKGQSCGT